jgi:hypothetical protein
VGDIEDHLQGILCASLWQAARRDVSPLPSEIP